MGDSCKLIISEPEFNSETSQAEENGGLRHVSEAAAPIVERALRGGHKRRYTKQELEFFAKWRDCRALVRPHECLGNKGCWVEVGPPGMRSAGSCSFCSVCGGSPRHLRESLMAAARVSANLQK